MTTKQITSFLTRNFAPENYIYEAVEIDGKLTVLFHKLDGENCTEIHNGIECVYSPIARKNMRVIKTTKLHFRIPLNKVTKPMLRAEFSW